MVKFKLKIENNNVFIGEYRSENYSVRQGRNVNYKPCLLNNVEIGNYCNINISNEIWHTIWKLKLQPKVTSFGLKYIKNKLKYSKCNKYFLDKDNLLCRCVETKLT